MRAVLFVVALAACGGAPTPTVVGNTGEPGVAAAPGPTALVAVIPADTGCALARLEGDDPPVVIATVKDACYGARIARSPDRSTFLLWFDPSLIEMGRFAAQGYPPALRPEEERGGSGAMYEITVATGAVRRLPPWPVADPLELLAYAGNSIVGFGTHDLPDAKGVVTYLGASLDFTDLADGMPAAAIAYREVNGAWQLAGVERTTTGWDYAAGYSALALAQTTAPESQTLLTGRTEPVEIAETAVVKALGALSPIPKQPDDNDGWYTVVPGAAPVYGWMVTGEFTYSTGLLVWRTERDEFVRVPDLDASAGDLVALVPFAQDHVLITSPSTGTHPRVYNLVERRLVSKSDQARAAMPWF